MERWIRETGNEAGEWSLADLIRDYRICAFNHERHGGPHLHYPLDGPALFPVRVDRPRLAEELIRFYAETHSRFVPEQFQETVKQWRSASKKG